MNIGRVVTLCLLLALAAPVTTWSQQQPDPELRKVLQAAATDSPLDWVPEEAQAETWNRVREMEGSDG